jgi:hypothetical protein
VDGSQDHRFSIRLRAVHRRRRTGSRWKVDRIRFG